jgi:hypothetical protein
MRYLSSGERIERANKKYTVATIITRNETSISRLRSILQGVPNVRAHEYVHHVPRKEWNKKSGTG